MISEVRETAACSQKISPKRNKINSQYHRKLIPSLWHWKNSSWKIWNLFQEPFIVSVNWNRLYNPNLQRKCFWIFYGQFREHLSSVCPKMHSWVSFFENNQLSWTISRPCIGKDNCEIEKEKEREKQHPAGFEPTTSLLGLTLPCWASQQLRMHIDYRHLNYKSIFDLIVSS